MKKKAIAAFLAGVMVLGALTGCGSSGSDEGGAGGSTGDGADESDKKAAIELTYIFADGDEGAKESMNEIVNRFNEANPDITVTIEPGNGGAYSEFLKTKDSVGEFPDVMEMRDTAVYVRAETG